MDYEQHQSIENAFCSMGDMLKWAATHADNKQKFRIAQAWVAAKNDPVAQQEAGLELLELLDAAAKDLNIKVAA